MVCYDFGASWFGYRQQATLLRCIAPYLTGEEDRLFIKHGADSLRGKYLHYDWSLNV